MNRTIILVLALLIGIAAPCQSKKECVKNKIKSTTEWETTMVDGKVTIYKTSYEEFDKSGRTLVKIDYAPDGSISARKTAVFDSYGNKTAGSEFDAGKKRDIKWTYRYNALKDKIEEIEYNSGGEIQKKSAFSYDANGNKISETETDASGSFIKKTVYTYNSKNLKTGKTTTSGSQKKDKSKTWEYVYY
ncbi:MAG: hypothetical protein IH596_01285 [Bacteroidales bacterium]|nr:hypothetical protein [Bacteroidales bacterium]